MKTSAVHYGSLAIPFAAKELVDRAFAYLRHDAVERTLIQRVEHSAVRHRIVINHRGNDSYRPDTHTIHWDPTCESLWLRYPDEGWTTRVHFFPSHSTVTRAP